MVGQFLVRTHETLPNPKVFLRVMGQSHLCFRQTKPRVQANTPESLVTWLPSPKILPTPLGTRFNLPIIVRHNFLLTAPPLPVSARVSTASIAIRLAKVPADVIFTLGFMRTQEFAHAVWGTSELMVP